MLIESRSASCSVLVAASAAGVGAGSAIGSSTDIASSRPMLSGGIATTSTPPVLGLVERITASSPSASRTRRRASRELRAVKRLTFKVLLR